jgi:hypothetical protein
MVVYDWRSDDELGLRYFFPDLEQLREDLVRLLLFVVSIHQILYQGCDMGLSVAELSFAFDVE